jgi:ATP dependent DNA ligase domain
MNSRRRIACSDTNSGNGTGKKGRGERGHQCPMWVKSCIDGEVVVPAADGTTDFSVLQNELKGKSRKIVMVAFDLLYLNGYNLRKLPLRECKAHLKKLIGKTAIQLSESFEVDGAEMLSTPARPAWRASSPRSRTVRIIRAAAMTGSKKPTPSARR